VFHLLYVDGWDCELGEPRGGGRCVDRLPTLGAAMRAVADYALAAPRLWGPGALVVTDAEHRLVATHDEAVMEALARAG
jgi:hypothetical protein